MKTTHNLEFEVAPSRYMVGNVAHQLFRVGTCDGQFGYTGDSYFILSVTNSSQGNGHLTDVFEWFEASCKRDNKNLLVLECMNKDFYRHLLEKRGFVALDKEQDNCIKIFNKKAYKQLIRKGNPLIRKGTLTCV